MKSLNFGNRKLDNNGVEKIAWRRLSIKQRLEKGLSWGYEMEHIHQKLFGKTIKLRKLRTDLEIHKATFQKGKQ